MSDEPASPVCYAGEADASYMGYAGPEEIATFLKEQLAAEQALAGRLRAMLPRIRDDALHALLRAMLADHERAIAALGARLAG